MEKRISETGLKMIACHKAKPTPIGSNYIILKSTKMQKEQTPEKGFVLLKNDIIQFFSSDI